MRARAASARARRARQKNPPALQGYFFTFRGRTPIVRGSKQPPKRETLWNHYTRVRVRPRNVKIFNFLYYTIALDGWNFQIGALGILGIPVGGVSGGRGRALRNPR
jgi:hypothetical protein